MRLLYVSQHFGPEISAPSMRVHQLARRWATRGHDVTVLTAFPNHPTGRVFPEYRSRYFRLFQRESRDGYTVARVAHAVRPNSGGLNRLVSFSSFAATATFAAAAMRRFDVVIGTSPSPFAPYAAWARTRLPRRPFVLEVRDLWPESIQVVGLDPERSVQFRALRASSKFLYRRADAIVAVTPSIRERIVSHYGVPGERVAVIPAAVDTDMFRPGLDGNAVRAALGIGGRFIVSYVGTLGVAHGVDVAITAMRRLRQQAPDVLLLLAGGGAERERLEKELEPGDRANVLLVPPRPLSEVPGVLAASDACLVLLRDEPVFRTAVPTKMLEYLASGRPVISNVQGDAAALLEQSGGGMTVLAGDGDALADAVLKLRLDAALRAEMGQKGRQYVEQHSSWDERAERYEVLFRSLVARGSV